MRDRIWRRADRWVVALLLVDASHVSLAWDGAKARERCAQEVVEGEVREGESLRQTVVPGRLELEVDAVAGGWVVRLKPVDRGRPEADLAELATPPHRSVHPLRITTEFGFRAQDAVGWNPRHFRFATDAGVAARMQAALRRLGAVGSESRRAETDVAELVGRAPEGVVELLDADGRGSSTRRRCLSGALIRSSKRLRTQYFGTSRGEIPLGAAG